MKFKKRTLAYIAAVAAYSIWGFSFLASTKCQQYASPFVLLMYRFDLASFFVLIPVLLGRVKISITWKKLKKLLLPGLFEPVLYFIGEQYGVRYTSSSFAGIAVSIIPITTMIIAFIAIGEHPKPLQWIFSLISILGVIAVTGITSGVGAKFTVFGVAMLLFAVLCGSLYSIISCISCDWCSVYERTLAMQVMGGLFYTILAVAECRINGESVFTPLLHTDFIISILFLAIGATVIGYTLFNYALANAPLTNIINFYSLNTVVAVAAGVLILNEPFSVGAGIALFFVLLGIWGVQRFSQ